MRLVTRLLASKANVLGLSDDCAALPWGEHYLLATTDTFAESTHFPRGMSMAQRGRMACAASLSDIAAKGGEPLGLLLALGLPAEFPAADLEEVVRGFAALAEEHGAEVLGGDTKPARELTLSIAALGRVAKEELLPRSGIVAGDALAVTGQLGGAAAGLAALERGLGLGYAARLLEPPLRLPEGRALAASGAARASMDLSDGLAAGLHQLAAVNRCGFLVREEALPVDALARRVARGEEEARRLALPGGGDSEILAALRPGREDEAQCAVEAAGGRLTLVGRALAEPGVWLERRDARELLEDQGWEHFRGRGGP